MRRKRIVLILIACLLLTNSVMAMSSPNYRIDWMALLSAGGGRSSSTNYVMDLTIGQTPTGAAQSSSYQTELGFWYGFRKTIWELFMPITLTP